jgi:alanine racemase
MQHRVNLNINLSTLGENYRSVAKRVAPCLVMPILKANAYGLGVEPIAKSLVAAGAQRIGVAEPFEAMQLLSLGVPIQLLSGVLPDELEPMLQAGVILPVVSIENATAISECAQRLGMIAKVHVKVDTGMGRAGILWQEASSALRVISRLPALELEGLFTHFPLAYESHSDVTQVQIKRLLDIYYQAAADNILFKYLHAANSDAINNAGATFESPFNLVRCGINLHGAFDAAGTLSVPLRPVLTLTARIAQIRTLPAGMSIGYGHTYTLPSTKRIGTIAAGYADGLPLALSNRGEVLLRGKKLPIVGRISMDYLTVDLTDVPEAQAGDVVTLLGREGEHEIRVEEWAAMKGTHAYDVICSIGSRVARCYVTAEEN